MASTSRPVIPGSFFSLPPNIFFSFLSFSISFSLFLLLLLLFLLSFSFLLLPSIIPVLWQGPHQQSCLHLGQSKPNTTAIFSNATIARFLVAAVTFWSMCMVTSSCHFDFHFFNMWLSLKLFPLCFEKSYAVFCGCILPQLGFHILFHVLNKLSALLELVQCILLP